MSLTVVPDEDDASAELVVGGDHEVAVLGPGEAAPAALSVVGMAFGPVDQAERSPAL